MASIERTFAWGGGAAFVGSLAMAAWTFASGLGGPTGAVNWPAAMIDAAALLLFAAHHSIFARGGMKDALAKALPPRILRTLYVYVASILLAAVCLAWRPVGGELFRFTSGVAVALSWSIRAIGLWLIVSAARAIDPLELAGIRAAARNDDLTVRGPYALVRHPLYLGWILIVFGGAHMTGDRLVFALITSLYLVVAIPWEERDLITKYGDTYRRYARNVRWRLVPGLY
jgi:methanethiol S-methyltransferase